MRITQVFRSLADNHVISDVEIGGVDTATPVPATGDNVRWVVKDKVYAGRVKSRLISYSAPDNVGLDRLNEVDVTVELYVELATT